MSKPTTAITPTRSQDFPEWYQQVIKAADLAEVSAVRGCMVIKPWGYAIWENMQSILDRKFKETGHVNAYFPLLIPLSFLEKEASHVDGFAKECAVVTHHRLEQKDGKLVPAGELEEPFIIRPTSETIIGASFSKWVQSYRDLPILINQWANVLRWEMRTRLFLRTAEFLWQEGHTVHATSEEAQEETMRMLDVYAEFAEKCLAIPVIKGEKTADEKFPGAVDTFTIEAMMQDGKALQAGTSHFLGQNFAKASEIKFSDKDGKEHIAWTTSWGVSTRLIGAMIMTHSDDDGLIMPPRVATQQVVIIPIFKTEEEQALVLEYAKNLQAQLKKLLFANDPVRVFIDNRDMRGGEKSWDQIKKGVPLRVEVGPRDVAQNVVFVGRRDHGPKDKKNIPLEEFIVSIPETLQSIQDNLFHRAFKFREEHTQEIHSKEKFLEFFNSPDTKHDKKNDSASGFAVSYLDTNVAEVGEFLKQLKVTARCMPLSMRGKKGKCFISGNELTSAIIFAKSY